MKLTYLVWDAINETAEDAREIEAACPQDAAGFYAEQDCDGLADGLYYKRAQPIVVQHEGKRWRFDVSCEFNPVFFAKQTGGPAEP